MLKNCRETSAPLVMCFLFVISRILLGQTSHHTFINIPFLEHPCVIHLDTPRMSCPIVLLLIYVVLPWALSWLKKKQLALGLWPLGFGHVCNNPLPSAKSLCTSKFDGLSVIFPVNSPFSDTPVCIASALGNRTLGHGTDCARGFLPRNILKL